MQFNRIAALAAAAFIACAAPAAAQTSTQMVAARQLVEVSGAVAVYEGFPVSILEQAAGRLVVTNQDPKFRAALVEVVTALRPEFANRKAEMIEQTAAIYATRFTEAELKEITAFYATPTGKKLVAELPKVAEATLFKIREIGDKISTEVTSRLREEMKKRGFAI